MHHLTHARFTLALLLSGVLIIVMSSVSLVHSADPGLDGLTTLDLVLNTEIPPRDRIDLAQRLRGVANIPAPPASAPELQIGAILTFNVDNLEEDYTFQVQAELVYKTPHIYMFVEVGYPVDLAAMKRSAEQLENEIRPVVHEVFGSEWSPGIDGDPHLFVLNASNVGSSLAGYFNSSSEYPTAAVPHSNEHEMFFVNYENMQWYVGGDYYASVLAHEFQHMVHWRLDENEASFINEGMSELATLLTGTGTVDRANEFLSNPTIQLTTWPEDGNRRLHYGAGFLFATYFYQRYGAEATTTLVRDPANGLAGVENTLRAINATDPLTGEPVTVVDLFADWTVANLLQNPTLGDGRYGYSVAGLGGLDRAALTHVLYSGEQWSNAVNQFGAHYLQLPVGTQHIQFSGQETVSVVPADPHSGQYAWWSNRADSSDMRLTRTVDLRGVDRATLSYWTWYHIENGWDYAYLFASTDGGATWTPLSTPRMTDDDPHVQAYGPGYSGTSGGWVQEQIDLSAYAGQSILLRFEYITDDAVNQPGMLIDDVSIPEIGYFDDFETGDGGWVGEGWLRMDNMLPQRYVVQLLDRENPNGPVTRLLDDSDLPAGNWTLAQPSSSRAILVISAVAPVTTESAPYNLTATTGP